MDEEMNKYIEALKQENANLDAQIKVIEEDRDQTKLDLQHIMAKYIELLAEKEGKTQEEIYGEISEEIKNILKKEVK